MAFQIKTNVDLSQYTSLGVGGKAERFAQPSSSDELIELLQREQPTQLWIIGYGSNTLISDKGLDGLTVLLKDHNHIEIEGNSITVDSGAWWDDVVAAAVSADLWGIELLSEIPGSVGGALHINIAAYGQHVGEVVDWVDVWDPRQNDVVRLHAEELPWAYKQSVFQTDAFSDVVILRCRLNLSRSQTTELTYQKALDAAKEIDSDVSTLQGRRDAIIEARRRAGSIWSRDSSSEKTAGSFFRNPIVQEDVANAVIAFDESGLTADVIKNMNLAHGGNEKRVSAAHVMLAAGFTRGQKLSDNVKLHEKNVLKIEALDGATSQEVYEAMRHIQSTVESKLNVILEPEVKLLGDF